MNLSPSQSLFLARLPRWNKIWSLRNENGKQAKKFILAKQLCTCITLFCTFLSCRGWSRTYLKDCFWLAGKIIGIVTFMMPLSLKFLKACSLRKFFNWESQKCHFLRSPQDISSKKKYEGKCSSLLFILPTSSVIGTGTVFTGEEEGKTETPSRSRDFCYNRYQY